MIDGLRVRWVAREPPLRPIAVVATGPAAVRLSERLDRAGLPDWRGVGGVGWIAVLGDEPPWVDGAVFLGRDPDAPRLLVPTFATPECAGVDVAALVDEHVARRCAGRPGPYAVVPGFGILPLGVARPLTADRVAAWRRG